MNEKNGDVKAHVENNTRSTTRPAEMRIRSKLAASSQQSGQPSKEQPANLDGEETRGQRAGAGALTNRIRPSANSRSVNSCKLHLTLLAQTTRRG